MSNVVSNIVEHLLHPQTQVGQMLLMLGNTALEAERDNIVNAILKLPHVKPGTTAEEILDLGSKAAGLAGEISGILA